MRKRGILSLVVTLFLISFFCFSLVFAGELKVTTEHPFLVNGCNKQALNCSMHATWVPASQLHVGDYLTTDDGRQVKITGIQDFSSSPFSVYNFATPENDYVANSVVVHNSNPPRVVEDAESLINAVTDGDLVAEAARIRGAERDIGRLLSRPEQKGLIAAHRAKKMTMKYRILAKTDFNNNEITTIFDGYWAGARKTRVPVIHGELVDAALEPAVINIDYDYDYKDVGNIELIMKNKQVPLNYGKLLLSRLEVYDSHGQLSDEAPQRVSGSCYNRFLEVYVETNEGFKKNGVASSLFRHANDLHLFDKVDYVASLWIETNDAVFKRLLTQRVLENPEIATDINLRQQVLLDISKKIPTGKAWVEMGWEPVKVNEIGSEFETFWRPPYAGPEWKISD